ncbi:hypothetical protein [Saccharopolyspora elongata]|uniref:Uncharacterized protein n=1 Tax=Saccharopolyspora elongata TaxID=2530387 RepID=A0A4R4YLC1_9PSEU|nr:hypothetical protein [Saccharopolyspora elongata]TDD44252.1 hypothetical protein E1288_24300 [Saccharopolyspora elongata]
MFDVFKALAHDFGRLAGSAARHKLLADRDWDVERRVLAGAPAVRVLTSGQQHASIDRAVRLLAAVRCRRAQTTWCTPPIPLRRRAWCRLVTSDRPVAPLALTTSRWRSIPESCTDFAPCARPEKAR